VSQATIFKKEGKNYSPWPSARGCQGIYSMLRPGKPGKKRVVFKPSFGIMGVLYPEDEAANTDEA
jgi:hypothetical protein